MTSESTAFYMYVDVNLKMFFSGICFAFKLLACTSPPQTAFKITFRPELCIKTVVTNVLMNHIVYL